MLYSEDWLLRQIESMIDAIIKKLSGKNKESIKAEHVLLQDEINSLIEDKNICEAENLILDRLDASTAVIALGFYRRINKMDEKELNELNFSHKEIFDGISLVCSKINMDSVMMPLDAYFEQGN